MTIRQRRPRDAGSIVVRKRKDGTKAFMLKWRTQVETLPRSVTTLKEANEHLARFVARAQSGEHERQREHERTRNAQPTLNEWAATFLANHVTIDADKLATRAAYESALRLWLLPTLGAHRLHEITPAMVRETMRTLYNNGRAVRTIRLAHAVLRKAFDAAIEDGHKLENGNPVPKFSKLGIATEDSAADHAKRAALNSAQVSALLSAAEGDPLLKLYVATLAGCGMRPGEVLGLRWRDVDLDAGVLHVQGSAKSVTDRSAEGRKRKVWIGATKTKRSKRDVAIGPALGAMLTAERERQEAYQRELRGLSPNVRGLKPLVPVASCVFPSDPTSAEGLALPVDPARMRDRFADAAERAGLKTTPHALRHTHISHAIEGGLSLADTAARVGHASVMTTARTYVHVVNESQRKAALIGDSLLSPAEGADVERLPNAKANDPGHK